MFKALMRLTAVAAVAGVVSSATAATLPAVGSGTLRFHLDAGSGVNTSGSAVTQWNDLSGNNNHFGQAAAGSQPQLVNGVLNGLPVVRFTNDQLTAVAGNNLTDTTALPFSFFVVTANNTNPFAAFDSRPGQPDVFRYSAFNGANPNNPGQAVELWDAAPFAPIFTEASGSVISTQAFLDPQRNLRNRTFSDGAGLTNVGRFSTNSNQIGFANNATIGSINLGGNGFYSGDIAEMIYYDGKLSVPDQFAVEQYLRSKYSVAPFAVGSTQQLPNPTITTASNAFATGSPFAGAYDVRLALDGNILTDYASNGAGTDTFIDFDFGAPTLITRIDYTDRTTSGAAQGAGGGGGADNVTFFNLIFSQDPTFGNGDDQIVGVNSPGFANTDIVSIAGGAGISARYLRWDVTGISGPATNNGAGEFAFFTTVQAVNAVPEPATLSLLGLGGVVLLRRRRRAA